MAPGSRCQLAAPPDGKSHGENRFQRSISHPLRLRKEDQTRTVPIFPLTTAFCGPP